MAKTTKPRKTPTVDGVKAVSRPIVLNLTLHRHWFEQIASGQKTEEYRFCSPFWERKLDGRHFDEIHFRNGYSPDSPWMRVSCLGITLGEWAGRPCYVIALGQILEIRNYETDQTQLLALQENRHAQAQPTIPDTPANGEPQVLDPA